MYLNSLVITSESFIDLLVSTNHLYVTEAEKNHQLKNKHDKN